MIEIKEAIITDRDDGIIHVHFKEGTEINVELQSKLFEIYNKICAGEKKAFMFSASEYVTVTKDARENAVKMAENIPALANAVIAHSIAYKLIANFYFIVNKPTRPFRIFNDEEKAVEWLRTFM